MKAREPIQTLLAVGGLDPSGGAGILLDGLAARSLGLHAAAVAAVITVQDGRSLSAASASDPALVSDGIATVLAAQDVGAVKTGALGSAEVVEAIAVHAAQASFPPLVVDPVLGSTSGGQLLDRAGASRLREALMPLAAVITPNAAEAGALAGTEVRDADGALRAAELLIRAGARAVLVKGGHLAGDRVQDLLVRPAEPPVTFGGPRIVGPAVRGTGCALASLVAGHLALGADLEAAVARAREGLLGALGRARAVGSGPLVLGFG
jgi:hydroxymethylpyrimidine/phosphomethylpyrimidine kinase